MRFHRNKKINGYGHELYGLKDEYMNNIGIYKSWNKNGVQQHQYIFTSPMRGLSFINKNFKYYWL